MLKGLGTEIVMWLHHVKPSDVVVLSFVLFASCVGTELSACSVGSVKPGAYYHSYKMSREH